MINLDRRPTDTNKLFFGDNTVARLDMTYDSQFKKIAETDEANVWFLNVVSCKQDRWGELPPHGLSKFQKTVAYQTVSDTLVPDVFTYLSGIATDPWLKYLYSRISTMENVHGMSYSSGVDQAFGAKANEFLDIIYTDPRIKERIESEKEIGIRFIKCVEAGFYNTIENKKVLLELLFKIFMLEGVKFPFSFFTTWTLNRAFGNAVQGFSQLLIKISIDEMQVHTTTGANVIRKLRKSEDFAELFTSGWFDNMAKTVVEDVVNKEKGWAKYLLEDGEVLGFNQAICDHFIEYWADRRLNEINLDKIYNVTKNDIEEWFDDYRNVNNKHAALQEIDNISYQIGQIQNDLYKFDT